MKYEKDEPDNGYKSVLKEYDYYNKADHDFEIIDDITTNDITTNNINNKKDNNFFEDISQNSNIQNYILNFFKIIFDSRNQSSEFISDLLEYDNIGVSSNNNKNKYFIGFYLYEKDNNNLNNAKIIEEKKLLVEKWKLQYKEDKNKTDKNYLLYLNKKMRLIEKSIISYSRLLPLYNISKNEKYLIDFKFSKKNNKKFIGKKSLTYKTKIILENMFSFELSVKYLKINEENIEMFIKKNNTEFVIIEQRKRFLSDDFQRKSSTQLLNNLEKNDGEKSKENFENNFILENYIEDKRKRRLSYENNNSSKKYLNLKFFEDNIEKNNLNKIEINDSGSICSNEDNLQLVISENDNELQKNKENININIIKKEKINNINNKDNIKEDNTKKGQTEQKTSKYKYIKSTELSNLAINNTIIKNILQDYKNVRRMINLMPDFDDINHNKLSTFISNN